MTARTRQPKIEQLPDTALDRVHGGLIGLLKPADLTTTDTTAAGITKTGTGTLTLGSTNTYGG